MNRLFLIWLSCGVTYPGVVAFSRTLDVTTARRTTAPTLAPSFSLLSMTATNNPPTTNNTNNNNARSRIQGEEEENGRKRRRLKKKNNDNNNIMKDETGHVNRDLAERIWKWEQSSRQEKKLPKVEYSVRSGLRLVDEQVKEVLSRSTNIFGKDDNSRGSKSTSNKGGEDSYLQNSMYADLVQEGLTALLDAMSHYREEKDDNSDFEAYASRQIHKHLQRILYQTHRPIRLPRSVREVLKQAKQVSRRLQANGQKPSVAKVADEMDIPLAQLQDYLHLTRRRTLSMESTVEVYSPVAEDGASFVDQEDWEISQGMVLDDGHHVNRDQLIDEFLDETIELEGDDQAWIQQEQIAGPLQDLIPDLDEPSPDDTILTDLIRHDVREFLDNTLNEDEQKVVRMVFGIDSGRQVSIKRTAEALGMEEEQVSLLMAGSLQKLRESYNGRYVDSYLDDEYSVDSV
eukprot:scaffold965_cov158-Amphora_coffeaeformis.AAC.7